MSQKMDQTAATEIAERVVKALEEKSGRELSIVEVMERPRGWVFFFTSTEFLRTRRDSARLVGNGPIYVRDDGEVFRLPSRPPLERRMEELEAKFPGRTFYGPGR